MSNVYQIALIPGDGIGIEVVNACRDVLAALETASGKIALKFVDLNAGAQCFLDCGEGLPQKTLEVAKTCDATLFGAGGLPHVRNKDGTEIQPQLELRTNMDLYVGLRPARLLPGVATPLRDPRARDIDLVIVREQTEGLFADLGAPTSTTTNEAINRLVVTRPGTERIVDFALNYAQKRKLRGKRGHVTCVDKANVLASTAFFRKIFEERLKQSGTEGASAYVDAVSMRLVQRPWDFDVLVTENMFGDILSDLAAGLIGGLGFAPSADIGDEHGVFQPCHGSAPDIAGKGIANPTATFLSAVLMLDWLAEKHADPAAATAATLLDDAIVRAYGQYGMRPIDLDGEHGTRDITNAVIRAIESD